MTATGYGFVGLGQMGAPMAARLAERTDGHPSALAVYDVRAEAVTPLAGKGARAAKSPADVARSALVVSVMVRDDEQVRAVLTGPDGILTGAVPGTVVAVHSTIRAGTAERLAEEAAPYGVAARNLLHFVAFTAAGEAQRLAEAAGIDLRMLGSVVRHSDAVTGGPGAIILRRTTAPLATTDKWFGVLEHVRDLGEKDLSLALDLGAELGVDLPLGNGELTPEELREIALFLTHYVGWPLGTKFNAQVDRLIAKQGRQKKNAD
jgi:3-hydroxyisobutyrate dehydrogenase-like beta-hydroxyacid dehydrogenase